ncbi:hypothetical protein D8674_026150 [Pyrus ussuriensis x Pyrus communis]|uniref:Neprosin PEP catalytic domain-containing protein n=1 Tax=Pyrus ussuriensis x Pyrus communis TaxID=2448454 RepID=A0A5N5I648_9ROSA|nr:hypothetical protein D8674_026150 [Pyrus ussuriensis x Pyrus communis]
MFRNNGCHNPLPPNIHVSPSISGDNLTRLYTYWTVNNGNIGCFNLLCAGFVQVDQTVYPGIRLAPVSIVGGKTYETKFTIYQDPHSQNWWFTLSDKNITVGYWPKEIFTNLRNGADEVGWGETAMSGNTLSPPVGSGRYPDENISHAAYFRSLHYMRAWLKELTPTPTDPVREYIGPSGCYGIQNDKDTGSAYWGCRFTYGGPGCDCGH